MSAELGSVASSFILLILAFIWIFTLMVSIYFGSRRLRRYYGTFMACCMIIFLIGGSSAFTYLQASDMQSRQQCKVWNFTWVMSEIIIRPYVSGYEVQVEPGLFGLGSKSTIIGHIVLEYVNASGQAQTLASDWQTNQGWYGYNSSVARQMIGAYGVSPQTQIHIILSSGNFTDNMNATAPQPFPSAGRSPDDLSHNLFGLFPQRTATISVAGNHFAIELTLKGYTNCQQPAPLIGTIIGISSKVLGESS